MCQNGARCQDEVNNYTCVCMPGFTGRYLWLPKLSSVKRKSAFGNAQMRKFRLSCSCAGYHPGLCSPFLHSVVSNDSVGGEWRLCQTVRMCRLIWVFAVCPWRGPNMLYRIRSNYRTYPYKRTVKKSRSLLDYGKCTFSLLLDKSICCEYSFELHRQGICCGYSFELHRLVDAIQMSTHNICLYNENQKKIQ